MAYKGKHAKRRSHRIPKPVLAALSTIGLGAAIPMITSGTASAATLTPGTVAAIAKAGCPQLSAANVNIAVKIAGAESGLNTDALGDSGNSHGLWQIYKPAHPDLYPLAVSSPVGNAKAMCAVSGGGATWRPWSTYVNGAYLSQPGWKGVTGPVAPPVVPAPHPGHQRPSGGRWWHHWTVAKGDTLYRVAAHAYGDGSQWHRIATANHLASPNVIHPGQVLYVP